MDTTNKLETIPVCGVGYDLTYKNKTCKCILRNVGKTITKKIK